jgi:menaquinone-dependent protoporphyrinogen oxidase
MGDKVLVAYGTRTGTTKSIADVIGELLCQQGAEADVVDAREVQDAASYDAIVVGSAIRAGNLMPEVVEFVEANQGALSEKPLAAFVVCATLKEDTEENREQVRAYLDPIRALVEPAAEGCFAGAIDRSKLSLPMRLMMKAMKAEDGDWRDWDAVRAWAAQLPSALGLA